MDLYGHNPFSARVPQRLQPTPLGRGYADFSDLDQLARWVDRNLRRPQRKGRRLRLFLSEFCFPTDHSNYRVQLLREPEDPGRWIRRALRITRRWPRIYTFGYLGLYDPPAQARPSGRRGLIERSGRRKPAFDAFKRG